MTAMSIRYPAAPMLGALTRGREHLSGADLHLAGLSATSLPGADLRGADLREARLRDSCLHAADLRDADLRDADLGGADLDAADLQGADLDGANLRAATFSPMTAWPPGFDPLAAGATPTRPSRRLTRSVFAAGGELHASWNEHRLAGMVGPTMLQVSATPLCQARPKREQIGGCYHDPSSGDAGDTGALRPARDAGAITVRHARSGTRI